MEPAGEHRPTENGFIESFNGKLGDELLNREISDTLLKATVLIERWRVHYNTVRLHSSLGYRPPAPEAVLPASQSNQITTYTSGTIHGGRSPLQVVEALGVGTGVAFVTASR